MLSLRPYKRCDAEKISKWASDEHTFLMWGGTRFGDYPVTGEAIDSKYLQSNGDCTEEDNFYPLTAVEDGIQTGHLIIRYLQGNRKLLRLGWVIVDPEKRGRGYGKQMVRLALEYAFTILKADTVTIGVYENNEPACRCYLSCGFRPATILEDSFEEIDGQTVRIAELEMTKEEFLG